MEDDVFLFICEKVLFWAKHGCYVEAHNSLFLSLGGQLEYTFMVWEFFV